MNDSAIGSVFIQKIYSTSFYLSLSLRIPGKTMNLYIGRGHGKEGIWLDDKKPESFLRKRDKFLEYFRKHLSSAQFEKIEIDSKDRIFSINYLKWGHVNKLYVFYNARNLYFCHHFFDAKSHQMKLFNSWTMKTILTDECSFDFFDEVGRVDLNKDELKSLEVTSISKLLAEEKKQAMGQSSTGKSMKFFNRKRGRILGDLKNVQEIGNLQVLAEDQSKLESLPYKNKINGIKLKFQYTDFYKRRDEVYTKIKKLKKAKNILELRLKDTDVSISQFGEAKLINNLKTTQVVWKNSKKDVVEKKVADKQYRIVDLDEIQVGIGQSAVGNDQLRSEWANKSDYWFHLDGDKSAHIIIKLRESGLTTTILSIAGSALVEFSQVNYAEANIIYTQVKNVKGVKGVAGKVIYKKEKRLRVEFNSDWRNSFSSDDT